MPDLTLCATTRLAQILKGEVPAGRSIWQTRLALTPAQWLTLLADEARLSGIADLPVVLDPFAERLLWEKVIGATLSEAAPLFDLPGMAASAAEAHALCRVWRLPAAQGMPHLSDEAKLFLGWQAEFERRCREHGWIDAPGLQRRVIDLIAAGHFTLPKTAALVGFDRRTPLEDDLVAALAERGVEWPFLPEFPVDRSEQRALACADREAECQAVVAWAYAQWIANPSVRLGIVAPDLASVRDRLEFLLDDTLHPACIRPDAAEHPRAFNFSLGRPLADLPLVRIALDLLALGAVRGKVEQARISTLLLAGGWSAADAEADGRARLDAVLRRELPYFTTVNALLRMAGRMAETASIPCPETIEALQRFSAVTAAATRKQLPRHWAGLFRVALTAVGWPGDRPLSSHEFQARQAFLDVLAGFGRLDSLLGPIGFGEAVRRLTQLCRQRVFQPETRGSPAIQVLGVLESAGLAFDALWVMGMNDEQWPPPPRPNPLLSAELQRSAGAAHASAEVELAFARQVHTRLSRSAPDVCFSYALADGNRVLRRSPLLAGIADAVTEVMPVSTLSRQWAATAAANLDRLVDAQAPAVAPGEKVAGGSWLLRAQAICPAWAFFQYRLAAEAMEEAVEGLDPAARGTLVHGVLEAFWSTIRSSDALVALGDEGRHAAIAVAVDTALATFEQERRVTLPARFRSLEAVRLARLVDIWLQLELKRTQSFSVLACEEAAEVDIEGIKVKMVVDRIDQLADGSLVIIDYKTGAAIDTRNWAEQRLTEPQLPIYAALVNEDVVAVVFAKVLVDKPAFAGVADAKDILPGVQGIGDDKQKIFNPVEFPDWISVITHWRERLHAVAREVQAGVAGVVFADAKNLQYCEVLPLLRLPERQRLLAEALAAGGAT